MRLLAQRHCKLRYAIGLAAFLRPEDAPFRLSDYGVTRGRPDCMVLKYDSQCEPDARCPSRSWWHVTFYSFFLARIQST
jgi:hypothetical protein